MKLIKKLLFIVIFLIILSVVEGLSIKPASAQPNPVNLYLFHSETCLHCKEEIAFLESIKPKYPNLEIHEFEISRNFYNAAILNKVASQMNIKSSSVPITIIGAHHFSGYLDDQTSGQQIIDLITQVELEGDPDIAGSIIKKVQPKSTPTPKPKRQLKKPENFPENLKFPLIGEVSTKNLSLPALTFVIAAIDGFNPCAMWVLLFLISLLLGMKDRKKMWILGITFIVTSGAVYFLFLAAWLNLFLFLGFISWIRILVGIIALGAGFYQLREFYKNRDANCKVVNPKQRSKITASLKKTVRQKSFLLALFGIITIAIAVNLIELVCSAGLPAIYTQVLALSDLPALTHYGYLLFYIVIFMIDDLLVFVIAMTTLKAIGLHSKFSRYSSLIGGILIFIIGALMIFKPEILTFAN